MPKYARVDGSTIVEVVTIDGSVDISKAYHPSISFIPCNKDVTPNDHEFVGGSIRKKGKALVDIGAHKLKACKTIMAEMQNFLARLPDGSIRYDTNFLLMAVLYLLENGMDAKAVAPAKQWIKVIQGLYVQRYVAILSATTVEEIDAIVHESSYDWMDAHYGINGTFLRIPT